VGKKWGYIDTHGTMVIEPSFDNAGEFGDGLAEVEVAGKRGYINVSGAFVWPASD
jgi:hypothetical protein